MFCNQCEQTAKGQACIKIGVCGKTHEVDELQDLLVHALVGLSEVALKAEEKGVKNREVDHFLCEALFSTLTNVNFDPERIADYIRRAVEWREKLRSEAGVSEVSEAARFESAGTIEGMIKQGEEVELRPEKAKDPDIFSLKLTVLYALKGIAAYAYHAAKLGKEDEEVYRFMKQALVDLYRDDLSLEDWVNRALEAGRINLRTMELLDAGNTESFGHPVPTKVSLGQKAGPAILVSGHDLKDLYELLKQTEGTGINVYTHGEMLPAHGYPELKKFKHLVGHYGTAWQNQQKEFPEFPGPIVMTTNCLMPPKDSYKDRVFTLGPVGFPGVKHIPDENFAPVIEMAKKMGGFPEDRPGKEVMTGFARNAVLSVADKVIEAVKSGSVRHFFLVGGCDGAKPVRNYYTEFVEKAPKDTLILTLACGKFRFFDKDLGEIGGIPRLLDVGQCNDAYSAIQIALALSKAFNVDVNQLPLSLIVSWYEQKAVAILLTLLYLGIKNIRLGPSVPAFLSENVLKFLAEKYNLRPISTPDEDLRAILG
ncbi:hydroxylamine reductase [Thermosulfurimonas marina]|uniref:Hydroxylamine reductase n=1 Tax=Thermosulfurimonas marina TaxID=2047767 RepID=A0A6H1WUH5_9BACT|nr:hydroxylamine reductase [Thermosulfurimonas marina]QJA06852.1 hydroxylamine reductase [Thermosulfurimonas marina]